MDLIPDIPETEEGKEIFEEFVACVKKHRRKYMVYPLLVAICGGVLYDPKESWPRSILRRGMFSYILWCAGSLTVFMRGVSQCRGILDEYNRRIQAEKRGIFSDETRSTPDLTYNKPPASDLNLPKTSVDDPFFSGFQHNIYDDFKPYEEEASRPKTKKSVTYEDLWQMEKKRIESGGNAETWNDGNSPDTRKQQRKTNEYGDPIN